jgi:3-oxoacyl-[acyl-carrier-protein] synthase-3
MVGLSAISYAFPRRSATLDELAAQGQLASSPELLRRFGFESSRVAEEESAYDLGLTAARSLLDRERIDPESIDLLVHGGCAPGAFAAPRSAAQAGAAALAGLDRFKYPGTRMQAELGLARASVLGLSQLACNTLFGAVRVARSLCHAEGLRRVLCVGAELVPADAGREALWNCTSDAGCAVLVEAGAARRRIVAQTQVTKGYYWDCDAGRDEMIASYFPTARHVIEETLERAGWRAQDVDWIIPHNVSLRSWQILLGLLRLPRARLYTKNLARDGHTLAGDNFINLADACAEGAVREGERLLLFSYGYGAHWTALAVEA